MIGNIRFLRFSSFILDAVLLTVYCSTRFILFVDGFPFLIARHNNNNNNNNRQSTLPDNKLEIFLPRKSTSLCSTTINDDNNGCDPKRIFCSHLSNSLQDGTFRSFSLFGPTRTKKGNKKSQNKLQDNNGECETNEQIRGCFKIITGRRVRLERRQQQQQQKEPMVQVTFKYHLATDVVKNWPNSMVSKQVESIFMGQLEVLDDAISEWGTRPYTLGSQFGIQRATLETSTTIWELDSKFGSKKPRLKQKTVGNQSLTLLDDLSLAHDRVKVVPVSPSADFLQALGVTNPQGQPRPNMASKLRQIQKFVEIVGGLVHQAYSGQYGKKRISVVDMGCGRGYLTFALHSFLRGAYPRSTEIHSRGIDIRKKLVDEINDIARSLGEETFGGLTFETGAIENFLLEPLSASPRDPLETTLEVLIALHACDTATDDALWVGISRGAHVICVAPCCHKEIRPQIDSHYASNVATTKKRAGENDSEKNFHPLADLLRYGIYRERMTETATDALRALLLEMVGYDVNLFEYIGGEHTSKNVMITAVKKAQGVVERNSADEWRSRLRTLAQFYGISHQRLAGWMKEDLIASEVVPPIILTRRKMPKI